MVLVAWVVVLLVRQLRLQCTLPHHLWEWEQHFHLLARPSRVARMLTSLEGTNPLV